MSPQLSPSSHDRSDHGFVPNQIQNQRLLSLGTNRFPSLRQHFGTDFFLTSVHDMLLRRSILLLISYINVHVSDIRPAAEGGVGMWGGITETSQFPVRVFLSQEPAVTKRLSSHCACSCFYIVLKRAE